MSQERAHVHPNTIARAGSEAPTWEEDLTRPGDPSDIAALAAAAMPSVVTPLPEPPLPEPPPPAFAPPSDPAAVLRAETDRTIAVRVSPRERAQRTIAIAAASALAGLGAGYLVWGGSAAVATSIHPAAQVAVAAPVAHSPPAPTPAPAPAVTPAAAPAPATCHARFTDAPDGATVQWGDVSLGVTPLAGEVEVPCGDATIVLTHPRYERLERTASAAPDAPAIVDAGMKRPLGTLALRSDPPGAKFTVDGTAVDQNEAKVHAYTQVSVAAAMPGYAPASKRVYVRGPHDSVTITLVATGRRR